MHSHNKDAAEDGSTAWEEALRLTAPAAVSAIAAVLFSSAFDAPFSATVGVGFGAALGAGVGAWFGRSGPTEKSAPPEPPRHVGHEIAEFVPLALLVLDSRGRVQFANAAARADFGEDIVDRHYSLAVRAPAFSKAIENAAISLDVHGEGGSAEASFALHGRQERHMRAFVRAVPPDHRLPWGTEAGLSTDERRAGYIIIIQDITRARRADRLHRDFVANASHELKTPLASIAGFVETLRGPAKDDHAAHERFLQIIADQAKRMTQLVEDLLSLNRIEINEHVAPTGVVEMKDVVAAALKGVSAGASSDGGDDAPLCDVEGVDALPPVRGDDKELVLAVGNLISNALKYGGDGRRPRIVGVTRSGPRPMAGVAVEDFGAGIAKDHLPRLCERFYRADGAATRGKSGTGLGLAIVKHVTVRHRGELAIDSELGRGSSFTVWIPQASSITDENIG